MELTLLLTLAPIILYYFTVGATAKLGLNASSKSIIFSATLVAVVSVLLVIYPGSNIVDMTLNSKDYFSFEFRVTPFDKSLLILVSILNLLGAYLTRAEDNIKNFTFYKSLLLSSCLFLICATNFYSVVIALQIFNFAFYRYLNKSRGISLKEGFSIFYKLFSLDFLFVFGNILMFTLTKNSETLLISSIPSLITEHSLILMLIPTLIWSVFKILKVVSVKKSFKDKNIFQSILLSNTLTIIIIALLSVMYKYYYMFESSLIIQNIIFCIALSITLVAVGKISSQRELKSLIECSKILILGEVLFLISVGAYEQSVYFIVIAVAWLAITKLLVAWLASFEITRLDHLSRLCSKQHLSKLIVVSICLLSISTLPYISIFGVKYEMMMRLTLEKSMNLKIISYLFCQIIIATIIGRNFYYLFRVKYLNNAVELPKEILISIVFICSFIIFMVAQSLIIGTSADSNISSFNFRFINGFFFDSDLTPISKVYPINMTLKYIFLMLVCSLSTGFIYWKKRDAIVGIKENYLEASLAGRKLGKRIITAITNINDLSSSVIKSGFATFDTKVDKASWITFDSAPRLIGKFLSKELIVSMERYFLFVLLSILLIIAVLVVFL